MKEAGTTLEERFLKNIHKVVYIFDRHADQLLVKSQNATFSQFLLFTAIANCPGHSQQGIATFLNLTPAAISRQIDNLVAAGYVIRKEDPQSRRAHIVHLSDSGKKKYAAMRKTLTESFNELGAVTSDELELANGVLKKVLGALGHDSQTR